MEGKTGGRRMKISVTVDPELLEAVDLYVQKRPELDRSKVMDAALAQWYSARQADAMVEQFSNTSDESPQEQKTWRKIRRAAASRRLSRVRE